MNNASQKLGRLTIVGIIVLVLLSLVSSQNRPNQAEAAADSTLLSADFNAGTDGFIYQDDVFGTSQPAYADGGHSASGGYGGTGGLQVNLGGVDNILVEDMSGGWIYTLNLPADDSGLSISFRYRIEQSTEYEFDEYSQVLVLIDGIEYGRGSKDYIDQIGGDGSSSQGNSATYQPTSEWQQVEIFIGNKPAGSYDIVIGGYNNKKDTSTESTHLVIDDVLITNANESPTVNQAQLLIDRLDISQFIAFNQGVAQFNDRCRGSGLGCSSTDYSTDYYNALTWVENELQAMGYTTVRHDFNYNGNTGTNLWATKTGSTTPTEMYMVSTHLDGRGGGDAYDDDGSGVALVMEAARVFAASDVTTEKSVRFLFWDKEELGLYGSKGYVQDRRSLQGTENEPTWLGLIQHDMILYDHGAGSASAEQSNYADLDVEWRAGTAAEADSKDLAILWRFNSGDFATDYPANAYNYSTNTDDTPFHPYVASVSVRENRRSLTSGSNAEWINPYYHQTTDVETSYTTEDTLLGFNTVQVTIGTIADLAGVQISQVDETIHLDPGWNLVSLPVNPLKEYTAQSILEEINSTSGSSCNEIDRWHNGSWQAHHDGQFDNNFDIQLGEGYFIKCSAAGDWDVSGVDIAKELKLELQVGWNLISVPYPPNTYQAQTLLDEINSDGNDCTEILQWVNSGWGSHTYDGVFNDFDINPESGYFINCN